MPKLSLREAAKASGMAKTTIRRAIDSGRISAEKTEIGHYLIDPSELGRFMDAQTEHQVARYPVSADPIGPPWTGSGTPSDTPQNPPEKSAEMRVLLAEQRAEMLVAQIGDLRRERDQERASLREDLEDLRADRDAWRAQAQQLLIEGKRDPEPPPDPKVDLAPSEEPKAAPSFWRRLFGG